MVGKSGGLEKCGQDMKIGNLTSDLLNCESTDQRFCLQLTYASKTPANDPARDVHIYFGTICFEY